jgi:hypothetical protein
LVFDIKIPHTTFSVPKPGFFWEPDFCLEVDGPSDYSLQDALRLKQFVCVR